MSTQEAAIVFFCFPSDGTPPIDRRQGVGPIPIDVAGRWRDAVQLDDLWIEVELFEYEEEDEEE